ncbi:MAG: protein kinase [Acidobacteria bacterium]|nr:protein kinase [Acidobacteriota bacterium]
MQELKLSNSLVDGRYEVHERLGRGSYSEIFVANDRQAQLMEVVIKALNPSLQGTPDPDLERTLVENFQNEAIALDTVRHANVILRWGHGTAADLRGAPFHYLVLEYMPGGDLLKLCRTRPKNALRLDEALAYFKQACEALAFAHSKGIIHRDLKPNNFLLSADQLTLKVADFGVAKIESGENTEITRVGADIYAPPEHNPFESSGQVDRLTASADIYSLAKSLYTVLCGRAPNQFICDPITTLPVEMMGALWGRRLVEVLCRATDDLPNLRYQTVVEFWNDLVLVSEIAEESAIDEQTHVKPRLRVSPGPLPEKPQLPDFDPALSRSGSHPVVSTATLVKSEPELQAVTAPPENNRQPNEQGGKPGKFYIDLQQPKPQMVEQAPLQTPLQTRGPANVVVRQPLQGQPVKATTRTEMEAAPETPSFAKRFSENLRRRIFMFLLMLAVLGSLVSAFNFVRGAISGIPSEIQITTAALNVRTKPTATDDKNIIGYVAQGTSHRVLQQDGLNWMEIEVSKWSGLIDPNITNNDRGWVYCYLDGKPPNVKVVARRWW